MSTILDAQHRAVLLAVKALAKPWSTNGGAQLEEIASFVHMGPLVTGIVLSKLEKDRFVIRLMDKNQKQTRTRYYLNIYPAKERK